MTKFVSSREFNQDTSRIKRAARDGPVFITERGRPAHVLLTIDEYQRLTGTEPTLGAMLGSHDAAKVAFDPVQLGDLDFELPDFD